MIVVEGFDCSGKSTLVDKLQRWTGFAAKHSGGPPRDLNHTRRCLARCAGRMTQPVIQDRVTHLSEGVYGMMHRPGMAALAISRLEDLRLARLLVYCRPSTATILDRLAHHRLKGDDTPEHVEFVTRHAETLICLYDALIHIAAQHVDVYFYDYEKARCDIDLQVITEGIEP